MVWLWVYILSGWVIGMVALPVLARRCAPAKAWGWLAMMFALPWLGLGLYLLLGENPLGRKRVVLYREVLRTKWGSGVVQRLAGYAAGGSLHQAARGIERLAQAGGALPAVGGNAGTLLADHGRIVEQLVADIDRAAHSVHMTFYIFRDDRTGRQVADALRRAAGRGVACRVLADAVGSHPMLLALAPELRAGGVDVRAALPINPLRKRLSRIDLRNHRKIAAIDGRVGYIGSWNVADPDYGRGRATHYLDLLMRLEGPIVWQVQLLFLEDWRFETEQSLQDEDAFPPPQQAGDGIMQAVPSGPMYPSVPVRDLTVSAIHLAERRVVMTTPYLVPDEALMLALCLAAGRGVRVDVIVPERSDNPFVDAAGRSYIRELVAHGVAVHLYPNHVLHSKTLTVDHMLGMIGSANFDIRSFCLDVEANLLIYSPPLVNALLALQDRYVGQSRPVGQEELGKAGRLRQFGQDVARLLSPLI
ncbi:MAG TPA: cardiolipin synthase [Phycisphaerae bacterium]|nr:cardiolipin synthase [Phycisphaerae bacterium]